MYGEMRSRFNATIKEWTRQEGKLEQLQGELEQVQKLVPETEEQVRHKADELELLGKAIAEVQRNIRILDARSQAIDAAMTARRTR